MSDERLPLAVLDVRRLNTLEGRILVHGEEDTGRQVDRSYFMLEKGQTDRFTTSTIRRNWKPHAARTGKPIHLCGFENYSPKGIP